MADNVVMNAGSGGQNALTKSVTHSGDTAQLQGMSLLIASGSEGSWTITDLTGGAGAVSAGTPRVTLASDDPAVARLALLLSESAFTGRIGEVQASPTSNTVLDRLKALLTELQLKADLTETQPVSAASLPLPSGAATSALQGAGLPVALGTGGGLKVDGSGTALPVSATALPLPSGAATSTLQGGGLPAALGAGGGLKVDGSGTALPTSLASLPALAAGTNLIGKAAVAQDVDSLYSGVTAYTIKSATLSTATTGDQQLVAAVVGKTICLLQLVITAAASTNAVYIDDGTAAVGMWDATRKLALDVTGAAGVGGISLTFRRGWRAGDTNRPINVNLGSANGLNVYAEYIEL